MEDFCSQNKGHCTKQEILSTSGLYLGLFFLLSCRIPLHTIEESAETSHSELKSDSIFEAESQSDTSFDCLQDDDATLSQIRNLFEVPYNGNYIDDLTCLDRPLYGCSPTDISSVASPSVSLIQQFEKAAKVEAATCIQKWYKMVRDRRRFLEIRHSAIVIQRYFRAGR